MKTALLGLLEVPGGIGGMSPGTPSVGENVMGMPPIPYPIYVFGKVF